MINSFVLDYFLTLEDHQNELFYVAIYIQYYNNSIFKSIEIIFQKNVICIKNILVGKFSKFKQNVSYLTQFL